MWNLFEDYLYFLHHFFEVEIFAYTMMPNHTHMLARFPQNNMSHAMNVYQRDTSLEINRLADRSHQSYGSRFKPILIESKDQLDIVYRYIYQNPVRARICDSIFKYPYSTISALFGRTRSVIPITVDGISEELHLNDSCRAWLQKLPDEFEAALIKKCMSKTVFKMPVDGSSRRIIELDRAPLTRRMTR